MLWRNLDFRGSRFYLFSTGAIAHLVQTMCLIEPESIPESAMALQIWIKARALLRFMAVSPRRACRTSQVDGATASGSGAYLKSGADFNCVSVTPRTALSRLPWLASVAAESVLLTIGWLLSASFLISGLAGGWCCRRPRAERPGVERKNGQRP